MEKRYKPLTEARRTALRTIRKPNARLDPEDDSDDDMYTADKRFKEGEVYDIKL